MLLIIKKENEETYTELLTRVSEFFIDNDAEIIKWLFGKSFKTVYIKYKPINQELFIEITFWINENEVRSWIDGLTDAKDILQLTQYFPREFNSAITENFKNTKA